MAASASYDTSTSAVTFTVVGKKLRSAKRLLRKANCRIGLVSTKDGAAAATGRVVRQVPNPGKVVPAHPPVSLRLGHA